MSLEESTGASTMEAFLETQEMIKNFIDETLDLMGPEENPNKYVELVDKRLKKYAQTGDVKHLDNIFGKNPIRKGHKKGSKENVSTDSTKHPPKTPKQKVLQNVLEIAEEVVVEQEMPPSTMLPKHGCTKKQPIVIRKEPEDKFRDSDVILKVPVEDKFRDSDVILQVPVIPTIDLSESYEIIEDIMTDDEVPPITEEANQKVAKQEKSGSSKQKTSATSHFVGAANKFNFKSGSASAKPNRFLRTPELSTKAITAYKASQEEYREREKQKREKDADVLIKEEDEALQKMEAMFQTNIEQEKKKHEEKELKAKEHREALEQVEKQKVLVMQKQKEEMHKMNLLRMAEELQKSSEEFEKKLLLIKQKKQEMLPKDNPSEKKHKPIYLVKKMPLLPTYDSYDSDEKDFRFPESRMEKPAWLKREKMYEGLRIRSLIKDSYINTLFCLRPRTPNLEHIFENIDPEKLVRKSSAVWKNPPRFSRMPNTHEAN